MNPLQQLYEVAGAGLMPYGQAEGGGDAVELVDTFGAYEAEYAAVRKSVGLMDQPQRGVVEVTGADRVDFLHRLLTHDTKTLVPGQGRRAFLLSKAGRIEADVLVLQEAERALLVLECYVAGRVVGELDKYLFSEDVKVRDASGEFLQLSLHGPGGGAVLEGAGVEGAGPLDALGHRRVAVAGQACVLFRWDETGDGGLHLLVPRGEAVGVYRGLLGAMGIDSLSEEVLTGSGLTRGRPIGWLAYNTARIEAGQPIFHIDFGADSLPHETGVLDEAVSFTKGCYVGQEVVARMQNLGHPKRVLVGLRFEDDRLPIAGSQVLAAEPEGGGGSTSGQVIGAVTSSTVSPMLGGKAVALAMVKWGVHREGTGVVVPAEGQLVGGRVSGLGFLGR